MKSTLGTIVIALLLATQVGAQDAEKTRPKETRPASPPHGTTSPSQAATPEQPRAAEGQLANVRIELTITDQRGDAPPVTKTVSMMTADRTPSRVRTRGDIMTQMGPRGVILNVDARPLILPRDKVRLELTIEYHVPRTSDPA